MFLIVIICFLLGLNCTPMIYNSSSSKLLSFHEKPVQEVINVNQYDLYTIPDLFNSDSMANYINWVFLADGVDLFTITSNYTRGFSVSGAMYFNYLDQNLTLGNMLSDDSRFLTIQRIELISQPKVSGPNNSYRQFFALHFISTTSSNKFIEIKFNYVQNNNLASSRVWYTGTMGYTTNGTGFTEFGSNLGLVVEYQDSLISGWCRSFLPYNVGGNNGYFNGYNYGYSIGVSTGYTEGFNDGYDQGYVDADGSFGMDPQMLTIFTGILNIGLTPVNVFLTIFNFEVFGINIAGFVSSLLTISIVIIIIRFITGSKND